MHLTGEKKHAARLHLGLSTSYSYKEGSALSKIHEGGDNIV
jgi:hypothetical protein